METEAKLPHLSVARIVPLWVFVFFAGWFVMQTELVGARTLTPYFGNSIFVWGSVIAVFLLALALGYGLGGRLTRKCHSHWAPAVLLILAGGLVALSVIYQDRLCGWMVAKTSLDVRWGSLLASLIIYGPPMILAGTISPFAVHLATGARSEVGSRAGTLYAVSTIGSFIGSLITSFLLIPSFPLPMVVAGGGALAAAAAVVMTVSLSLPDRPAAVTSLLFAGIAVLSCFYSPRHIVSNQQAVYTRSIIGERLSDAAPSSLNDRLLASQNEAWRELKQYTNDPRKHILLKQDTAYHRVMVTQEGPIRWLTFGEEGFKGPQTVLNLNNLKAHIPDYTGMLLAPILYKQDVKRVLVLGLGGGDVARGVETCFPNVEMDVVEIDPAVIRVAQKYFFWRPSRKVIAFSMDGRSFINLSLMTGRKPYDWVIMDIFDDDFIPFHLNTEEFYYYLQQMMAPGGVFSLNTRIDHTLYSYQARTIQKSFGQLDAYMAHRSGNMVLVAQKGSKTPMTADRAVAAMKTAKTKLAPGAAIDMQYIVSCLLPRPNWEPKGETLTDTWAPVESMMAR